MRELEYPLDSSYILRNRLYLKRQLQKDGNARIPTKIAVLGGSTTHDICECLQLFLLNQGIDPVFYESEYNKFWEDAMFPNKKLDDFKPDIIYIHTSTRNITVEIDSSDSTEDIKRKLDEQYFYFEKMWKQLRQRFQCTIIQNNFERPIIRLYGNKDISDEHGFSNFIYRLNGRFYKYAQYVPWLYINDIDYISSSYGLNDWYDPVAWHMYKYVMAIEAIPDFCYNLSNIIKSLYGKNKKVLSVDLDNTLWGGIISEEGIAGIELGEESAVGEVYGEIQRYIKRQKEIGVILAVNSKNEISDVELAFSHPDMQLKKEDFAIINANWNDKDKNMIDIAHSLGIGVDSMVFMDDNPVERAIVRAQIPQVAVPELDVPEKFIKILDRAGYFEVTSLTDEDKKRTKLYQEIRERNLEEKRFIDYNEFLVSLDMEAYIQKIDKEGIKRIAQLINKSNQFNLTAKRFTENDLERIIGDENYIGLYGRLKDRFGDNGIVSVVIARKEQKDIHIELFLMSCRVLKRGMEDAMMDELIRLIRLGKGERVIGYYYKTIKNSMVENFYPRMGFELYKYKDESKVYKIHVKDYTPKNTIISLRG